MERAIKVTGIAKASSVLLLATVLLAGCGGNYMHSYQSVGGAWDKELSLSFESNGLLNGAPASLGLYVGVRYSTAYPYKNLCLQVETFTGSDSLLSCDTVCCNIYDDKGNRSGTTAGTLYQAEFYAAEVPVSDSCKFRLRHIMQDSLLQGVYDVGVRIASPCRHQCEGK